MSEQDASDTPEKQIFISDDRMKRVLEKARQDSYERGHRAVLAEHVLLALLDEPDINIFLREQIDDLPALREKIHNHLKNVTKHFKNVVDISAEDMPQSQSLNKILQGAATIAQENDRSAIGPMHVLHSFMQQYEGRGLKVLHNAGLSEDSIARYLRARRTEPMARTSDEDGGFRIYPSGKALESFATNLTAKAKDGALHAVTGRDREIGSVVQALNRLTRNNALVLGSAGTGRRALVEGLAHKLVSLPAPSDKFINANIFALNTNSLLAGAKFQGEIEERLKNISIELAEIPNAILFIEDLHITTSAGRGTNDISAALKSMLSSGKFRCIARESVDNYRRFTEKDSDYDGLFQKIHLREPTVLEAYPMVESHRARIEAGQNVAFSDAALKACTDLSSRHIHNAALPSKAINLAEEVASRARLEGVPVIERDLVEEVVAITANISRRAVSERTTQQLLTLAADIKKEVFHQDEAINAVATALKVAHAGMNPPGKPIGSFIFSGPTGVGKTEVAKKLAEVLGIELIRIDMTEYSEKHAKARLIGAPPGYVGYEGGGHLTEEVNKKPYSVLLLDEIEKAHPDVMNVFLQVMDDARLTDGQGRLVKFDNVIIIMTTNAGAVDRNKKSIGFNAPDADKENKALKEHLLPEFRNRVDAIVEFKALDQNDMTLIVDKFIGTLNDIVAERNVHFTLTDGAKKYLARTGFDAENGARPMNRTITAKIKRSMADEILDGRLKGGGEVTIDFHDASAPANENTLVVDELSFTFGKAAAPANNIARAPMLHPSP